MNLEIISNNLYFFSITLGFSLIYLFTQFKIRGEQKRRTKSLKKREIVDAVETDSPVNDSEKNLKEKGISATEDRFSFIRKAFPILLILMWGVFAFIPYIGQIPSVYISIITAIMSVIVGVSLRPFLENLFSGVVISFFKSIRIGDTVVIDDHYGLIEEIGLTYSVLKRWDWNRVVIPNAKLLQKEVQNFSMNDEYLWAYIEFYVAPDSDLELVESLAKEVAVESSYFNKIEDPAFWVMDIQKDTIKCWVAAWSDSPSDAWELRNDMRTNLVKKLQKHKIKLHQHIILS